MSGVDMPYRFRLLHRQGFSIECRVCRNQISSERVCHTIIVTWMEEFNHLDFCEECYNKLIQQYFRAQDVTTSTEHPELLEALTKLDA